MHDHNVMLIGDICTTQTGSRTEASQEGQNNLETVGSSGYPRQQARNRESHRSTRGGARHGCTSEGAPQGRGRNRESGRLRPCRAANPIERPRLLRFPPCFRPQRAGRKPARQQHTITAHAHAATSSSGVLFGSGLAPPLHAFPFQESSGLLHAFPFALCWCGSRRPRGSVCGAHKQ
jgi:hypothetical protein